MSNNKYIPLPGGKECRPVNPFASPVNSPYAESAIEYDKRCANYHDFEASAPTYPLTEVMPEGVEFDGVEVWQLLYGRTKWVTDVEKRFNTFLEFREYWFDRQTRLAIKPLKAIEPVKALKNLKN